MQDIEQNQRYSRNVLIEEIGPEGQERLFNSKVLIAGAGGLGSNVISHLASVGVGAIGIIDNDKVEISNLNRQFIHNYASIGKNKVNSAKLWIESFNPDICVKTYQIRLKEENCDEILDEYDVVIDCFDSYESKFLLNNACMRKNKPLIHGGVSEFYGQVMTILPWDSACLKCVFPEQDPDSYVLKGVISPTVGVIASIQSIEAVKVLLNFNKLLVNRILSYDGIKQTFREIEVKKNTGCPECGEILSEQTIV